MKHREIKRKFENKKEEYEQDARNQLAKFIQQSYGLDQVKIYELFDKHDKAWSRYARTTNATSRPIAKFKNEIITVTCSPAGFEDLVLNLYKQVAKLKENKAIPAYEMEHYERVAEMFRSTTDWEKFCKWLKVKRRSFYTWLLRIQE